MEQPIQVGDLVLRPVALSDTDALFQVVDANRAYLRRWLPWVDSSLSVEDTRKYREISARQHAAREALQVVILLAGEPIGMVGFHRFDWANRSTSIGYWLAEAHQGHGYMTSACRALIEIVFSTWELNRIEIRCAPGNTRSRAIPERLGFRIEGTHRSAEWLYDHFEDLVVYSLLADEFTSSKATR
ncbi:GNAT family N-acetyltransferase [bacterium]|nr:GNAT family N-acetyltransferase [bacterium]